MKTIRLSDHMYRGKAYLVGAGPGRADLITVRGLQVLQQADVVIYDRLVSMELLEEARPRAQLFYVGKRPGHHSMTQDGINQLLVAQVRLGKQVVRLKGGDPFVFGRGGEEALALREAGLPFEIVPGISSAMAVPAFAGIPLTQRGMSTSFAVVTGHECIKKEESTIDWHALARIPTLVVLMGIAQIEHIVTSLIGAGRTISTPTAVIRWGATERQQVVTADLSSLPTAIAEAGVTAPAVIVIGEVAALGKELAWFDPSGNERDSPYVDSVLVEQQPVALRA